MVVGASGKTNAEASSSKKLFYVLLAVSLFFVCLFVFVFGFSFKAYKRWVHFVDFNWKSSDNFFIFKF